MLEIYGSPRDGSGKPLHISGLLSRLLPAAPEGVEVRLQDMVLYKFSQVSALLYLPCQATVYRGFLRNACLAAGPAATPPRSPGTRFPWRAPSACSRSCVPLPSFGQKECTCDSTRTGQEISQWVRQRLLRCRRAQVRASTNARVCVLPRLPCICLALGMP